MSLLRCSGNKPEQGLGEHTCLSLLVLPCVTPVKYLRPLDLSLPQECGVRLVSSRAVIFLCQHSEPPHHLLLQVEIVTLMRKTELSWTKENSVWWR